MWLFIYKLIFLTSCFLCTSCKELPSVIIVGAGASGIAASAKLLENGFEDVKILEANDRVGGRIHSVQFGNSTIDLGAQWCHGQENNKVYELVKDLDLLDFDDFQFNVYCSSGNKIDQQVTDALNEIEKISEYEGNDNNLTLGTFLKETYEKFMTERFQDDETRLKIANEAFPMVTNLVKSLEGAFSLSEVSAVSEYETCEGKQSLCWKGRGYKTILDVLTKKYSKNDTEIILDDKILFQKVVEKITWNDNPESKILVKCVDGSSYSADHVIITVSLGVLKNQHGTLFNPSLPEEKIKAIEAIGMGAIGKVFLQFSGSWWDNNTNFEFLWNLDDKKELQNLPTEDFGSDPTWILSFGEITMSHYNPNLICAWITGSKLPYIENLPDNIVRNGVMFVLRKFLGKQFNISEPESLKRHKWFSDPNFRGTYTHQTLAARKNGIIQQKVLAKPLLSKNNRPVVLFAGEATNVIHFSTVHGAIESGQREASRLINIYN